MSREAGGDSRPVGLLFEAPKRLGGGKEGLPDGLWPPEAAAAAAANIEDRFCKSRIFSKPEGIFLQEENYCWKWGDKTFLNGGIFITHYFESIRGIKKSILRFFLKQS